MLTKCRNGGFRRIVLAVFSAMLLLNCGGTLHANLTSSQHSVKPANDVQHALTKSEFYRDGGPHAANPIFYSTSDSDEFWTKIKRIVFERNGYVCVVERNQTQERRLFRGRSPRLSPDGTRLAYLDVDDRMPFRMFDLEKQRGLEYPSLANRHVFEFAWSHDSNLLALAIGEGNQLGLYTLEVRTGELRRIAGDLSKLGPDIIPTSWTEGDRSIVGQDLQNLFEIGLDGSIIQKISLRTIMGDETISSTIKFFFSSEKRFLLFNSAYEPATQPHKDMGVFVYDLKSESTNELMFTDADVYDPIWLPDGYGVVASVGFPNRTGKQNKFKLCILEIQSKTIRSCGPSVGSSVSLSFG